MLLALNVQRFLIDMYSCSAKHGCLKIQSIRGKLIPSIFFLLDNEEKIKSINHKPRAVLKIGTHVFFM